jgi:hypothetical protein
MIKMKRFVLLALILYAIFNPKTIFAPSTSIAMAKEVVADPRIEKLDGFLRNYNSPLAGHADNFIRTADTYHLDWRLLPAIAGAESTFARFTPSCAGNNPFGWTSTSSPCGFWRFESLDDAIKFVGEKIGTKTSYAEFQRSGKIEELAFTYNPSGQEVWVNKVNYFMEELK